uniref:Death domain-containing protein n=1 Tax=Branchiostoma floridae TaxID=7739 RepID=C3ZU30_BRAFL|eukprot:XP_002587905.1 hypothetical protein BRAFLDRAFT_87293 [Branchiostoma floridae]
MTSRMAGPVRERVTDADRRHFDFVQTLLRISDELTEEETANVKLFCLHLIPEGQSEQLKRAVDVFQKLIKLDKIDQENLDFLEELLERIGRQDLIRDVLRQFQPPGREIPENPELQPGTSQQGSDAEGNATSNTYVVVNGQVRMIQETLDRLRNHIATLSGSRRSQVKFRGYKKHKSILVHFSIPRENTAVLRHMADHSDPRLVYMGVKSLQIDAEFPIKVTQGAPLYGVKRQLSVDDIEVGCSTRSKHQRAPQSWTRLSALNLFSDALPLHLKAAASLEYQGFSYSLVRALVQKDRLREHQMRQAIKNLRNAEVDSNTLRQKAEVDSNTLRQKAEVDSTTIMTLRSKLNITENRLKEALETNEVLEEKLQQAQEYAEKAAKQVTSHVMEYRGEKPPGGWPQEYRGEKPPGGWPQEYRGEKADSATQTHLAGSVGTTGRPGDVGDNLGEDPTVTEKETPRPHSGSKSDKREDIFGTGATEQERHTAEAEGAASGPTGDKKQGVITFGGEGSEPGKFDYPRGVVVSPGNEIFVADKDNRRVQVHSTEGVYLRHFPTVVPGAGGKDMEPDDVCMDGNGTLWVVGRGWTADHVVQYSTDGTVMARFDLEKIDYFRGIAVDVRTNHILVTDAYQDAVHVFRPDGSLVRTVRHPEGKMIHQRYVTVDGEGNILVSDRDSNFVYVFDESGKFLFQFGGKGSGEGQLRNPSGICTDSSGHIIVADRGNERVQIFTRHGEFVRTVRTGFKPEGLAVGPEGQLVHGQAGFTPVGLCASNLPDRNPEVLQQLRRVARTIFSCATGLTNEINVLSVRLWGVLYQRAEYTVIKFTSRCQKNLRLARCTLRRPSYHSSHRMAGPVRESRVTAADRRHFDFVQTLLRISDELTEMETADVKLFCLHLIPKGQAAQLKRAVDVFHKLIELDKIDQENLDFLEEILERIGRQDLIWDVLRRFQPPDREIPENPELQPENHELQPENAELQPGTSLEGTRADCDVQGFFDDVIKEVSHKWDDLAWKLGFHGNEIKVIRDLERDPDHRCREMLNRWRNREGRGATLQVLIQTLKYIGETRTAESLEGNVTSNTYVVVHGTMRMIQENLDRLRNHIAMLCGTRRSQVKFRGYKKHKSILVHFSIPRENTAVLRHMADHSDPRLVYMGVKSLQIDAEVPIKVQQGAPLYEFKRRKPVDDIEVGCSTRTKHKRAPQGWTRLSALNLFSDALPLHLQAAASLEYQGFSYSLVRALVQKDRLREHQMRQAIQNLRNAEVDSNTLRQKAEVHSNALRQKAEVHSNALRQKAEVDSNTIMTLRSKLNITENRLKEALETTAVLEEKLQQAQEYAEKAVKQMASHVTEYRGEKPPGSWLQDYRGEKPPGGWPRDYRGGKPPGETLQEYRKEKPPGGWSAQVEKADAATQTHLAGPVDTTGRPGDKGDKLGEDRTAKEEGKTVAMQDSDSDRRVEILGTEAPEQERHTAEIDLEGVAHGSTGDLKQGVITFGGEGTEPGKFQFPRGVVVSPSNEIFVADKNNGRVQVHSTEGVYLRHFPTRGTVITQHDVCMDGNGTLWVVGGGKTADRVVQYSTDGTAMAGFDLRSNRYLRGIALDMRTNHILVTDPDKGAVEVFRPDGSLVRTVRHPRDGEMTLPHYVTVDGEGNFLVTDLINHCVYVYDESGKFLFQFGGKGSGEGQLWNPHGICTDSSGHILVADYGRIQIFTRHGEFVRTIRTGSEPEGLAVGPEGQLVVTDWDNHTVTAFPDWLWDRKGSWL